jgi:hypothetical protein
MAKLGRPSSFTQEIADEICERIATTPRGLDFICDNDDELPSARTVHNWLNAQPEFLQSYLRARERQAALLMDESLVIADDASNDTKVITDSDGNEVREVCNSEWITRSKLRCDVRMRMAGKLDPKKWGEATMLKHADANGEPIQVDDIATMTRLASLATVLAERLNGSPDNAD